MTLSKRFLSSDAHRTLLVDHLRLASAALGSLWEKSSPNLDLVQAVCKSAPFSSNFLHSVHSLVCGNVLGQAELRNRHVINVVTFTVLLLSGAEIGVGVTTLVLGFGWRASEPICQTGSC